jgi:hypothetical protein
VRGTKKNVADQSTENFTFPATVVAATSASICEV